MFRLRNMLLFNVCSKCGTPKSLVNLNLASNKNTYSVKGNAHKSEKPICNYHHDAMDSFTNSLIIENMMKWKSDNFVSTNYKLSRVKSESVFELCDDPDHLTTYLQQCLDGYSRVSESALNQFRLTMTKHGKINGLVLIERLNEKYGNCIKKSELQMNFAEAYWANGNLHSMFKIFETFYPIESTKVNHVLDPIIHTIVKSHGVASVVMVSNFVNSIVARYGDYHPMCILWKYLFLSELFNDNLEAEKLLSQNTNLIENIQYLIPSLTRKMLKTHKVECVQRIMIILLKHKRMEPYQWILRSLFEYYYTLGNVRQCKEIMKHSIELNVPLPQAQQSRLIHMVLNNKHQQKINKEVTAIIFKLMF
ncbi:uncharacterized protein LOC100159789 [Acyrthosiphon pisum]|uniref:Uncharacterized protein n=1 Tax=Acyrthosiphon pisum TaxID=7029 RepID=A0A8R2A8C8_ACYPI|nr:uncharacterized protein LOC100159789 [Acyrthosiphon pisum]|eukprot:XP_001945797.2 PREDICTED: uncharacterized protein LOC100159789 [Acyrthosiphon pisum]